MSGSTMLVLRNGSPVIPGVVVQHGTNRPGGGSPCLFCNTRNRCDKGVHFALRINFKRISDYILIHIRAVGYLKLRGSRIDFGSILGAADGKSAGRIIGRIYKKAAVNPGTVAFAVGGPHAPVVPGIVNKLCRNGPGCRDACFGNSLLCSN